VFNRQEPGIRWSVLDSSGADDRRHADVVDRVVDRRRKEREALSPCLVCFHFVNELCFVFTSESIWRNS